MSDHHELRPLLDRLGAGDRLAVEALLARIRPYLHLLVRQQLMVDVRQEFGDSDIVQETLVRIHRNIDPSFAGAQGRFEGHDAPEFLAWVSQILRNVIADLERFGKAQKRDKRREMSGVSVFATVSSPEYTPEQAAQRAERTVKLAAALERLPTRQRDVLSWRVFDRLRYAEISQRTGLSEGALRIVFARAVAALRADGELREYLEGSA